MKNASILILIQAVIALLCGILMSKMSFVGRMGIQFLHRDYLIFKTWWKTALLILCIQLILIAIMMLVRYFSPVKTTKMVSVLFLVLGVIGAYATYIDFTTTSHKMMKGSFHSGGYLFWVGWIISCIYFLFWNKKPKLVLADLTVPSSATTENDKL
ncbi:hypothetical protein [Flavobacterium sp. NKUCC04_CG]|uniref:hypothetical protein n=1 Tax=Flavobacterium sp. NKUCC04_CG TaxID=2842121 RepID=UPI001C5AE57F|nr:hypothetical protein [Flavobacterium sp. NKUCC04_CG]MBW3518355.1 hypothetical protein [Flavobacterium sp. NKUCC04_CG]